MQLHSTNADGTGRAEELTEGPTAQFSGSWSLNGKMLVFDELRPTGWDLSLLTLEPKRTVRVLVQTPFNETHPRLSPDGNWLAYVSDESGEPDVYVQPFPGPGAKWRVSTDGGTMPVWDPHGRELFYRHRDRLMAVTIQTKSTFVAEIPRLLFEPSGNATGFAFAMPYADSDYDVAPDGRFIMIEHGQSEAPATQITLVQNWFEELKRRVLTK